MSGTTKPIQSISKAFKILTVISESKKIGVSELSRLLGWHKSTVFGIVNTLETEGYIKKDPDSSKYSLSLKLIALSSSALNNLDTYQLVHPHLLDITKKTGETTHFVLPDKYDVIYIDKVESKKSMRIATQIGKRMPMYCTGVGKAIMAFRSKQFINTAISNTDLNPLTKYTITDYDNLIDELTQVRINGYAMDNEEVEEGLSCVAVPVLNEENEAIAAISIAGPTIRMSKDRIPTLVKELKQCTDNISYFMSQILR